MNRCLRSLSCLLAATSLALFATEATAKTKPQPSKQQPPKTQGAKKPHDAKKEARPQHHAAAGKRRHARADAKKKSRQAKDAPSKDAAKETVKETVKEAAPQLTGDLALVKEAIDLARKGKTDDATATRNRIADPAGQKLVEWFILRHAETTASFSRYAAFIAANPEWPSALQLRRRAEARLWQERGDAAKIRGFTGDQPVSARGKLALARVKLGEGDREAASRLVRDAW